MYYAIRETLESATTRPEPPFAAVMTVAEWNEQKESFNMGIDMEMNLSEIYGSKAVVNYDSLTGTFSFPTGRICQKNTMSLPSHWTRQGLFSLMIPDSPRTSSGAFSGQNAGERRV